MKRSEFIRLAWAEKRYRTIEWWVRCFTEFVEQPNAPQPTRSYFLVKQPWGMGVVMPDGKIEKLDDAPKSGPTFDSKFQLKIDSSWLPNVKSELDTTLGILMSNTLLISESFGSKIDYINGEVKIGTIESIIAPRLTSDPEPGKPPVATVSDPIFVHELMSMNRGIEVIVSIMELFVVTMTKRTVLPPTGIKKFRESLLKSKNYNLNDPIQMADYESQLLKFDAEYLKDDPSFGKFTSGGILKDSRKKLYLSMGAEGGFSSNGTIVGIPTSLSEGQPEDAASRVAIINGSRAGSYSRGHETMEGGVAAKLMLAASNNYVITKDDCGSTLGLERLYTPWLVNSLKGRTIINGKSQVKVPMDADTKQYIGQVIRTRSPMYCRKTGEHICSVCAGDNMARYETGISLPLTEISHAILIARMKAMHTNALTVKTFEIEDIFS